MMGRRHFEALADILAKAETHCRKGSAESMRLHLADELALLCEDDNCAFDRDRFMTAANALSEDGTPC